LSLAAVIIGLISLGIAISYRWRQRPGLSRPPERVRIRVLAAAGMLLVVIGMMGSIASRDALDKTTSATNTDATTARPTLSADISPAPPPVPADRDQSLRLQMVGVWADNYQGKRTMTLKADGTGTIVAELTGWAATLYAERLCFDIHWHVDDGCLVRRTTGGEPAGKVGLVIRAMGDQTRELVQDVTSDHLTLLDQDASTVYRWRRQPP
jgi:hypothetical protein